MEWSKEKTLKLIALLQVNAPLWNPSLCDSRREKQKRREELRAISNSLDVSVSDTTKKIQHLRTQYNREAVKEARAIAEEPNEGYMCNWYAYDYLHFLKDSNKPYRFLASAANPNIDNTVSSQSDAALDCKSDNYPPHKFAKTESNETIKPHTATVPSRDEFSVFGEYMANELRSIKGEKNLIMAKKKIQDVIFEVKMGTVSDPRKDQNVFTTVRQQDNMAKLYSTPLIATMPLESISSQAPRTTGISEIIISDACHYSNFKVDTQ